jgi:dTDP-4-dehydrorhamnose 3,5-epimerase
MNSFKIIKGGNFSNNLGTISFVNDFNFNGIKRFYSIYLPKKKIIRAFHGHFKEKKVVFVISGSILLCIVKINKNPNLSKKNKVRKIILNAEEPKLFLIPEGYANGIMSIKDKTNVIFYSNKTLNHSTKDDYRYSEDFWGKNVWNYE